MVLTVEMQRYGQTFASGHAPPWNSLFGQLVLVKDGWPPSPSWRLGTVSGISHGSDGPGGVPWTFVPGHALARMPLARGCCLMEVGDDSRSPPRSEPDRAVPVVHA